MSTYKPQSKSEPINAETKGGDQLAQSRKLTQDTDDAVTKNALKVMRAGSGGSQN